MSVAVAVVVAVAVSMVVAVAVAERLVVVLQHTVLHEYKIKINYY